MLDLLIALFAAVAATIAMSRPNISGAIAGVAIATALVPPLCAVGLSFSHGSFENGMGALLLFCTNLFAIVVASMYTFTLMGILTVHALRRHQRVIMLSKVALFVLLAVLAGPLSKTLVSQLHHGRDQTALYPVTRAVARAVFSHVEQDPETDVTLLGRSSVHDIVIIHIASRHELPESYAEELRILVRREMKRPDMKVYVMCLRGQWLSTGEGPVPAALLE